MGLLKKYEKFKPDGSPGTRLFITKEYKCEACGSRKEANEIFLICTDKKQIFAVIKWRCHFHCEQNLKFKEYQLLAPATIDKLKRKVPIDWGEAMEVDMIPEHDPDDPENIKMVEARDRMLEAELGITEKIEKELKPEDSILGRAMPEEKEEEYNPKVLTPEQFSDYTETVKEVKKKKEELPSPSDEIKPDQTDEPSEEVEVGSVSPDS